MKTMLKVLSLGVALATFAPLASATTIHPGETVGASNSITVTIDATVASISGTLTAGSFTGTYSAAVVKDASNPYGADDLTFIFTVFNNAGSAQGIEHVAEGNLIGGFSLFPSVNVGYLAGSGGTDAPVTIDETINGTVSFDFTNTDNIAPGTGTQYLVIQTAAQHWTSGTLAVIDSTTDTVDAFAPATVPEPSSLMLLGTGLLTAVGVARRKFNA